MQQPSNGASLARPRQRAVLVQGLAVATIANGVTHVRPDWRALATGLERAMADWQGSASLPAIGDLGPKELERIVTASPSRFGHLAAWQVNGTLSPYIVLDLWTPMEVIARLESPVSLRAWRALATRWLAEAGHVGQRRRPRA